ncbi:type IV-A pilus assembly ATPase PilB [Sulfidibacter corallicola]|uniref:Type IV-A pilus assembly ATPase PilB n=1 Tax=Sulfidibacter corallicola TaxID=2818388 RepID=A0A8A4TSS5_SULCO|nr:type IV-A pilus assembly ATPase PilB [Sulfidibacter corallicola]QTD53009.1 type IV-A pilus assembly ATPase PilB [Sulfidibacter corallicola]
MSNKLGELLVRAELITKEQLDTAMGVQNKEGGRLGFTLIKLGYVKEDEITQFLSKQYGVPAINLAKLHIDPSVIKLVPADVAQKYQVLPVSRQGATLTLAMIDPTNVFAMDDIKFMTGYNVEPVVASELAIKEAITRYYGSNTALELKQIMDDIQTKEEEELEDPDLEVIEDEEEIDVDSLQDSSEEAPVVKLVNIMLTDAVRKGASDIHVEPYEKEFRVRYRIDGILHEVMTPPLKMRDAIISRLKILSKLDISEKRLPQDGRIKLKMNLDGRKKELDYRVSVLPTLFGEKVVLRLLDQDNLMLDLTKLGFEERSLKIFLDSIERPWGMVLVTGPTGSGKTNTLYSSIQRLNRPDVNIMTAEDPVEFNMAGINQVQVRDNIGLNFAAALRSFLRQDPNTILVGEIRDFETAEISIKASLTGHLVLSTLHTNDAPSTINRLMNMGIEPFLVATSVHCIVAQRLIRRVCKDCKEVVSVPAQALMDIGLTAEEAETATVYEGVGCATCHGNKYKGRVGLYEVMEITENIKEQILTGANAIELKEQAVEDGMITLRRSGLYKILAGTSNIEEVVRETVL